MGSGGSASLPGNEIGNCDLSRVCAARTTPGPQDDGLCTYLGTTVESTCTTVGAFCGTYAGGTGSDTDTYCKGGAVSYQTSFKVISCKNVDRAICEQFTSGPNLGLFRCGPKKESYGAGNRASCTTTTTPLGAEP